MVAYIVLLTMAYALAISGEQIDQTVETMKPAAGQEWKAGAYCASQDSAEALSRAMAISGVDGFSAIMNSAVPCYHHRFHEIAVIKVTLIEKKWAVQTPDGSQWEFWTASDLNGVVGWVWFLVAHRPT